MAASSLGKDSGFTEPDPTSKRESICCPSDWNIFLTSPALFAIAQQSHETFKPFCLPQLEEPSIIFLYSSLYFIHLAMNTAAITV